MKVGKKTPPVWLEVGLNPESILPFVRCIQCETVFSLPPVKIKDWDRWQNGTLIQDAMPQLSDSARELLISHTCGECFDALFPPETR